MTTKNEKMLHHAWPMLLLAFLLSLNACASRGFNKSDATAETFQDAALALEAESHALDATVARLNELVNNPAADLKQPYREFSRALDRLETSANEADARIQAMTETSAAYFATWDQQLSEMNYEVIRERSEERRTAVSNRVQSVLGRYQETQEVVRPMITYLHDLRKALSADLTAGGLEAVRDIAAKTEENARKVQMGLEQLRAELNESGSRLSSVMPANAQPAVGGTADSMEAVSSR